MDINYLTSLRHDHGLRGLHSPLVLAFRELHMMAESKRFESVYCVLKMKRLNSICLPMPSQSNLELARTKSYTRKLFLHALDSLLIASFQFLNLFYK